MTEIYNLVNADMWCHFDVHRIPEANISADLISAVLSQSLVSLDQILTVHHECSDGSPSLHGLRHLVCLRRQQVFEQSATMGTSQLFQHGLSSINR